MRLFGLLLIIVINLSACATPSTPDPSRCMPASPAQLEAIRSGIKDVQSSNDVRKGFAVLSKDYQRVYFVAAKIYGPSMDNGAGPGVWAISGTGDNPGATFSVNSYAREFSNWGDGSKTQAAITMQADGAREAETCAKQ